MYYLLSITKQNDIEVSDVTEDPDTFLITSFLSKVPDIHINEASTVPLLQYTTFTHGFPHCGTYPPVKPYSVYPVPIVNDDE